MEGLQAAEGTTKDRLRVASGWNRTSMPVAHMHQGIALLHSSLMLISIHSLALYLELFRLD